MQYINVQWRFQVLSIDGNMRPVRHFLFEREQLLTHLRFCRSHCSTAALQGDCSAVVQPAAEPHAAALDILFLWRFWNERTRALPRVRSEELRSLRALHTKNKYLLQWLLQLLHGLQSCSWPPDPQLLHTFPPTLIQCNDPYGPISPSWTWPLFHFYTISWPQNKEWENLQQNFSIQISHYRNTAHLFAEMLFFEYFAQILYKFCNIFLHTPSPCRIKYFKSCEGIL